MEQTTQFELILCIINEGFAETVMDAVKEVGAKGGTVLKARGTANPESEKFFNVTIHPEKEVLMILVKKDIKEQVLHAIYKVGGLNTAGQGIAFSMPVNNVVGIENKQK